MQNGVIGWVRSSHTDQEKMEVHLFGEQANSYIRQISLMMLLYMT